jgi:hypothetical protein
VAIAAKNDPSAYIAVAVEVLQDALSIEDVEAQRALFLEMYLIGLSLFGDNLAQLTEEFLGRT